MIGYIVIKGQTILVKQDGQYLVIRKGGDKGSHMQQVENQLKADRKKAARLMDGKTIPV
jgi:hypothetical protein